MEAEFAGLRESLQQTDSQIEEAKSSSAADLDRLRQRLDDLASSIARDESRLDSAIARFDEQASNAEAQRAERFETVTNDTRKESANVVHELERRGDEQLKTLVETAEETLRGIRAREEEARTLAASLGAIGVSGGFGEYATQQQEAADFWRWVSVGAIALLLVGAFAVLFTLPSGGLDWEHFVARLFVSGSLVGLSGYSANQSAKHRRVEREARKAEIELAALDPYLAMFDREKKNEIKAEIILRMVGHPLAPEGESDDIGPSQWAELLRTALNVIPKHQ
jgi:hypothetical protein